MPASVTSERWLLFLDRKIQKLRATRAWHVLPQPLGVWLMYRRSAVSLEAAQTLVTERRKPGVAIAQQENLLRLFQRERGKKRFMVWVYADCAPLWLHEGLSYHREGACTQGQLRTYKQSWGAYLPKKYCWGPHVCFRNHTLKSWRFHWKKNTLQDNLFCWLFFLHITLRWNETFVSFLQRE